MTTSKDSLTAKQQEGESMEELSVSKKIKQQYEKGEILRDVRESLLALYTTGSLDHSHHPDVMGFVRKIHSLVMHHTSDWAKANVSGELHDAQNMGYLKQKTPTELQRGDR